MSITDELREWAHGFNGPWRRNEEMLLAIADRIDAEHEKAITAAHSNGITEYGSMVAREYVKLPVDADGEVIHIGDRVENNERVVRIVLTDGSWEPSVYVQKLPNVLHEYFCNEISHYHEPTVEDVLQECCHKYHSLLIEDMNDAIAGVERDYIAPAEIIAEYAAKLRLRSDAE